MKKLINFMLLFCITALFNTAVYGQYFKEKDKVLNVGIGLGSALYTTGNSSAFPPISASFEFGLKEGVGPGVIGLGGFLGYTSAKYDFGGGYNWKTSYTVIGFRGVYHLVDLADKLDAYGGLMLGYSIVSNSGDLGVYSGSASRAVLNPFVGARYYLSDNFALMGELGYGFAIFNVGFALKF